MSSSAAQPRRPIESGVPDPFPYMHPLMKKNYGQWAWHDRLRPGEYRLDRSVAAVAHPAFEALIERGVFHEGAKAHPLHAAADEHVTGDVHATSPVSLARAPRQREGAQRSSERMYGCGSFQSRAAATTWLI